MRHENMPPEDQSAYKRHIENKRIEMSVTETAEDRGIRKKSVDVAKKALEKGFSMMDIVELTNLSIEEVITLSQGEEIDKEED
jgi:hypothetical protein